MTLVDTVKAGLRKLLGEHPALPDTTAECRRLVRRWAATADAPDPAPWRCALNIDHYGNCSPLRAQVVA